MCWGILSNSSYKNYKITFNCAHPFLHALCGNGGNPLFTTVIFSSCVLDSTLSPLCSEQSSSISYTFPHKQQPAICSLTPTFEHVQAHHSSNSNSPHIYHPLRTSVLQPVSLIFSVDSHSYRSCLHLISPIALIKCIPWSTAIWLLQLQFLENCFYPIFTTTILLIINLVGT